MPERTDRLMHDISDAFHIITVDPAHPLVKKIDWITRDSDEDRAFWASHKDPDINFFIAQNPGYPKGEGLLTLIPLTLPNISLALARFIMRRTRKFLFRGLNS